MEKIFYYGDKKRAGELEFCGGILKTIGKKELNKLSCCVLLVDERVLAGLGKDLPGIFREKVCLLHGRQKSAGRLPAGDFFDYLCDDDKPSDVFFKINRAVAELGLVRRLAELERELSRKNKELGDVVLVDLVSGCYNWRYFIHRARQELSRARRHMYAVSFLAVDIDYFRRVNELYNVKAGDTVIRELVEVLRLALRKEDVIARWREDEFFVILPYLARQDTLKVADRIRKMVSSRKFNCSGMNLGVKVSLGVVSFPDDVISGSRDVINALEKCLLLAKRRGGDTIVPFGLPPAKPRSLPARLSVGARELNGKLDKMSNLLRRDVLDVIYGFTRTIELKDAYTGEHVEYTSAIAESVARALKLPDSEIENVRYAGILHDLGKVGIDESILSKRGPLNAKEMDIIKTHPWIATEILREVHSLIGAIPAVLYHHERFDGKGYPLGLKGAEIPLSARIVAVADVYQALISNRPYRKAYTKRAALKIIKQGIGKYFDPAVVKVFFKVIKKIK